MIGVPAAAVPSPAWISDLSALRDSVTRVHPDAFHKLEQSEFDLKAGQLERDIPRLDDSEIIVRMAELVASLGDGHTRLTLPLPDNAGIFRGHSKTETPNVASFHHLPLRLAAASDGFLVTRATADYRDLLGTTVEAIDGQPIAAVIAALLPVVHGDNSGMKHAYLPDFLIVPEILHARGIAQDRLESTWTLRTADGRNIVRRIGPLPQDGEIAWATSHGSEAASNQGPVLSIRRLGNGILLARIREIVDQPDQSFRDFTTALYAAVDSEPNARLVVDLRGNPGGNNGLIDPLVRGAIERKALWRPGHLFILTDGRTFSAAQNLVNAFERWTPAVLVGEPTGAAPNAYGDARRITLPQSGLTTRISSLYWQDSSPQDRRDSVQPHLRAPQTIADLRAGRDPALAAIVKLSSPLPSADGQWSAPVVIAYRQATLRLSISGGEATFALPELRLAETAFSKISSVDGALTAEGRAGPFQVKLEATATEGGLVGYLEVAGKPYAFVGNRSLP